ncbi:CYTH domain-containing protein [Streptomyces lydicus]|uniref:CYTH domain-containing protein n=1 Tax=Streptomyces lydicus TaxID=47763 RepID=UPI0036FC705E
MPLEIERRFLVAGNWVPPVGAQPRTIEQGYLLIADTSEVRIRSTGTKGSLSVKSGAGLTRAETENDIRPEMFSALWPLTVGKRVSKTRYTCSEQDHAIEVDVFSGSLTGLIIAEIEFLNQESARSYTPPAWCYEEVTHDKRFRNKQLAVFGSPRSAIKKTLPFQTDRLPR